MGLPTYKKGDIVQGDTIPSWSITVTDFPDLTTSTISLKLEDANGTNVIDLSVGSGITVSSATEMTINTITGATSANYPIGILFGDLTVTDVSGTITTYFRIELNVLKQY